MKNMCSLNVVHNFIFIVSDWKKLPSILTKKWINVMEKKLCIYILFSNRLYFHNENALWWWCLILSTFFQFFNELHFQDGSNDCLTKSSVDACCANSDIFFVELKEKSQLLRALIYVIIRPQDESGGKYGFLVYVLEI